MIKLGVNLAGVVPQISIAFTVVSPILLEFGQIPTITSATDGKHKRQSAHKTGRAVDLRSKHISGDSEKAQCRRRMQEALGPSFDVLLEHVGKPNEHFHIEWDPK